MVASVLPLPTRTAVRVIVLTRLDEVTAARKAFEEGGSAEALHDLRVALRRLRTTLRSYREHLGGKAIHPKRQARRLAAIARATNPARDGEVQLDWLSRAPGELEAREASGVCWFRDDLAVRQRESFQAARRRVLSDLPRLEQRLRKRVRTYRVTIDHEALVVDPPFRETLAGLLEALTTELQAALDGVGSPTQRERPHRARILGKRVRYLLEPVAGELATGKAFIKHLKDLQDALGELNDAQLLAEEVAVRFEEVCAESRRDATGITPEADPAPGLIALARLLHQRKQEAYRALERDWFRGRGSAWRAATGALLEELDRGPALPVETERKYLLSGMPPGSDGWTVFHIEQGYLPGTDIVERLRRVRGPEGVRYFRTIKLGRGVARIEIEEPMERTLFEELWPLTAGKRVAKRRYRAPDNGLVWEIDRFLDRELVLAEVELESPDRPVLPGWLRPVVIREVTDDPDYTNASLAR